MDKEIDKINRELEGVQKEILSINAMLAIVGDDRDYEKALRIDRAGQITKEASLKAEKRELQGSAPSDRKRKLDVVDPRNPDYGTQRYIASLTCTSFPRSIEELQKFMLESRLRRIPLLSRDAEDPLWHNFYDVVSTPAVDANDNCGTLQYLIEDFGRKALTYNVGAEMEVVPLIDAALSIILLIVNGRSSRNRSSATSGNFRPDYTATTPGTMIPVFNGEDKTCLNYCKGKADKDPELDHASKTPWSQWEKFYGDIPYIFGYTSVSQGGMVEVSIGILDRCSQTYKSLFKHDIGRPCERPEFLQKLLTLLPVVKHVVTLIRANGADVNWQLTKSTLAVTKVMEAVVYHGVPFFEKKWIFRGTGASHDAASLAAKLDRVFSALAEFPADVLCLRPHIAPRVSSEEDNTVKAIFMPFAFRVDLVDDKVFATVVIEVVRFLQRLHVAGIVHNDIRLDNIMEDRGHFLLVDYDDAEFLDDHQLCPGLPHLRNKEHAPNIHTPHGVEVDVWSVGHLICACAGHGKMKVGGQKIKDNYMTISLDLILSDMESYL